MKGECDCCGSLNVELTITKHQDDRHKDQFGEMKICDICRSTWIFNVFCWPSHYSCDVALMKTLAVMFNRLNAQSLTPGAKEK